MIPAWLATEAPLFPTWTPEGPGLPGWIAIIAVTHVFVAHFAVGGGLYLITTERLGRKRNMPGVVDHARRHSRFFVLLTLVFGALSGVGIWFVIGLASPDTTFLLIRTFVWGWASEWCFFIIELSAAILYYKTWDTISPRRHMTIGWIYAIASIITLLIINGILTFMLTPGDWVETGDFWDGFFNPSYWPTTILRIGITIMVAGCFGLVTARKSEDDDARSLLMVRSARWIAVGLLLGAAMFPLTVDAFPASADLLLANSESAALGGPGAKSGIELLGHAWQWGGIGAIVLFGLAVVLSVLTPKRMPAAGAWAVVLLAFFVFGAAEYAREALRKPYSIGEVMYPSGIRADAVQDLRTDKGFLAFTPDAEEARGASSLRVGELMYERQCAACHTLDGYRGLRTRLEGWHENRIGTLLLVLEQAQPGEAHAYGQMPPLVGNKQEIESLKGWLKTLTGRSKESGSD